MPYLYILKCSDNSYYTGTTNHIERRLTEHKVGIEGPYTFNKRPLDLVFVSEFSSWPEAIARERQIKGWSRKKKEALVNQDWDLLITLSKQGSLIK